jgi:maltose alpha-D-glucosyltransferase/alpha-amylase
VTFTLDDRSRQRYSFAFSGSPAHVAAPGDGAWRALGVAMGEGRIIAALTDELAAGADAATSAAPTAVLVCRPSAAFNDLVPGGAAELAATPERDLGADQSNTSVVLGEQILLKVFRRLEPGLNPDLEMTAFLSEEAGFMAVPRLAGFAELIEVGHGTTTIAMAQEFIADGADAFESVAEALVGWLEARGEVSVEHATDIAADLGTLTAGMHAALADGHGLPEMTPREATRDEIAGWASAARDHLATALDVTAGEAGTTLRELGPRITEALTVLDALPSTPEVIRAHGDYHLGQVLIAPDGFRIIDFEGEPALSPEERRAHRPALRDVASMLRSLDHVGRSAVRRAEERHGRSLERAGLDLDAWQRRARERFLEAYADGLREARVWPDIDPALLRAFEIDKELYEFAYAATYLPSWLYAPTEGLRALFADPAS